jgi:hypothetical protein
MEFNVRHLAIVPSGRIKLLHFKGSIVSPFNVYLVMIILIFLPATYRMR